MTRFELITSDEYIKASVEVSVVSGKGVKKIREELENIWIAHKNELLELLKQTPLN